MAAAGPRHADIGAERIGGAGHLAYLIDARGTGAAARIHRQRVHVLLPLPAAVHIGALHEHLLIVAPPSLLAAIGHQDDELILRGIVGLPGLHLAAILLRNRPTS